MGLTSPSLTEQLCLSGSTLELEDPPNELNSLDPTIEVCNIAYLRSTFSTCKNNCPGVSAFGIIGGGALLAGVSAVGAIGTLPITSIGTLATLGVAGVASVGGTVMMTQDCVGPLFCTTRSGDYCLVVFGGNGLTCPTL